MKRRDVDALLHDTSYMMCMVHPSHFGAPFLALLLPFLICSKPWGMASVESLLGPSLGGGGVYHHRDCFDVNYNMIHQKFDNAFIL